MKRRHIRQTKNGQRAVRLASKPSSASIERISSGFGASDASGILILVPARYTRAPIQTAATFHRMPLPVSGKKTKETYVSDDLFNYFGGGSRKFEPLDDDLDLPEVTGKAEDSSDDSEGSDSIQDLEAKLDEDVADIPQTEEEAPATVESTPVPARAASGGFGAGLFDDDIADLDHPAKTPDDTPQEEVDVVAEQEEMVAADDEEDEDDDLTVEDDLAQSASDSLTTDAAAVEQPEPVAEAKPAAEPKKKRGHWDLIASVLGIGGSKKSEDSLDETVSAEAEEQDAATEDDTENTVEAPFLGLDPIDAPEKDTPLPDMFASSNDTLDEFSDDVDDLIGWNPPEDKAPSQDSQEVAEPVAVEVEVEEEGSEEVDEDFVEFEIEELTPSSRRSESGPRRKRRPAARESAEEEDAEAPQRSRRRRKPRRSASDDPERESAPRRRRSRTKAKVNDDFDEDEDDRNLRDDEEQEKPRRRRRTRSRRNRDEEADDFQSNDDFEDRDHDDNSDEDFDRPKPSGRRTRRRSRSQDDRDDSRQRPKYGEVPTWDETISGMIEKNIKNHGSSSGGRKPTGRRGGRRRRS